MEFGLVVNLYLSKIINRLPNCVNGYRKTCKLIIIFCNLNSNYISMCNSYTRCSKEGGTGLKLSEKTFDYYYKTLLKEFV